MIGSVAALSGALAMTHAPAQNPTAALTVASPKDLPGIWQGTLHSNPDQRLKLKITQTDAGQYRLTLYLVDSNGQSFEATKTTFVGGTLTFTIDMIGSKYAGQISPDGKTITGTWTWRQGPIAPPLDWI
ncbi:MAG: hypothetical protein WCC24_22715 [Terracidiphilus sp.]